MTKRKKDKWIGPIQGSEMSSNDHIVNLPDNLPAVYLWKRCLRLEPECATDAERFKKWLTKAVSTPFLHTSSLRVGTSQGKERMSVRSDFVRLDSLTIGGGELTKTKLDELFEGTKSVSQVHLFYLRLQEMTLRFGPVLYVGETGCLKGRISDHLGSNSPFQVRLTALNLNIEDTAFCFFPMPQSSARERQLLEQILTHLLVAPLTYRPG